MKWAPIWQLCVFFLLLVVAIPFTDARQLIALVAGGASALLPNAVFAQIGLWAARSGSRSPAVLWGAEALKWLLVIVFVATSFAAGVDALPFILAFVAMQLIAIVTLMMGKK